MSSTETKQSFKDVLRDEKSGLIREVGGDANWTLSSCKSGYGIDQLRDNDMDTYWQSDGAAPHLVNISFYHKTTIKLICLCMDFILDESYTPCKISIRAGNNLQELQEIEQIDLDKPNGWVAVNLKDSGIPERVYHLQIAILGNHQNGRDSHLRQVKIYSPVSNSHVMPMKSTPYSMSNFCR